jgi:hypothetical protein
MDPNSPTTSYEPAPAPDIGAYQANCRLPGEDFGWALMRLRQGAKVCRAGWNGKGMYLFLVGETGWYLHQGRAPALPHAVVRAPFIAMKTAQATIVPWIASQTDLLAVDWDAV